MAHCGEKALNFVQSTCLYPFNIVLAGSVMFVSLVEGAGDVLVCPRYHVRSLGLLFQYPIGNVMYDSQVQCR